eukprot:TRINITY_DN37834_c0_g1_i1.p1 TRINITY_DN37834_c0_g1~~TRINITY_DN37834_c0_g1_i1.p1  ORF type:complete len:434 (+),score=135.16 TRINITY_DN37834_c0_g1_i1:103-1404(+)
MADPSVEAEASAKGRTADEIMSIFHVFDLDRDGKISGVEIETMLRTLDAKKWTKEATAKLLAAADTDDDGEISLSEFWNWINLATKTDKNFGAIDFNRIVDEDMRKTKSQRNRHLEAKARKEADAQSFAEKQRQRTEHSEFLQDLNKIGVKRCVGEQLYHGADDDGDGFVDAQELSAYRRYELASVGQVKEVFRSAAAPEEGALAKDNVDDQAVKELVNIFSAWDEDGDGVIAHEELKNVLRTLNPNMTEQAISGIIGSADVNGDGYIDLYEFVDWLCGDDKKKKKAAKKKKEMIERVARISAGLHRQRADEAKQHGKQKEFEEKCHAQLRVYCEGKKMKKTCITLNSVDRSVCGECGGKHAWLCMGCGFVSYFDTCVNDCPPGVFGWSCVCGKCKKGKCGCKKPIAFHRKKGFAMDPKALGARIDSDGEGSD